MAHWILLCPLTPSPVYPIVQPLGTLHAHGGSEVHQYLPEGTGQEEVKLDGILLNSPSQGHK